MKVLRTAAALILGSGIWFGCSSEDEPKQMPRRQEAVSRLPEPFKFHKAIEVKPGLTFDVVGWGRGSELAGGYLILRSDSTRSSYRSVSDELNGRLVDAWNMDMDSDGNPEIFIQAAAEQNGDQLQLTVYEFNDSGSSQKLRFPELSSATKKNYRGKDSLYVKQGNLIREFPLFEEDTTKTSSTGKKVIEYSLRGNNFSVKELKEEEK